MWPEPPGWLIRGVSIILISCGAFGAGLYQGRLQAARTCQQTQFAQRQQAWANDQQRQRRQLTALNTTMETWHDADDRAILFTQKILADLATDTSPADGAKQLPEPAPATPDGMPPRAGAGKGTAPGERRLSAADVASLVRLAADADGVVRQLTACQQALTQLQDTSRGTP
ncbi:hypothetical protein P349_04890 [Enterobacter sp. DC4]|uniref:hypothetical protein n=1 Tax=Enterobacter sp. DC4 TaxID=1395580 RepID=UPI0003ED01A2|nr:hypothetical protein [Enterobacter sp. DC4]EWG65838.1 hypothetical protein P349_04890 [Enterobacter sp. DC4]